MGAALVFPIVVVLGLLAIWLFFGARKTRQQAAADATLPHDPYERQQEEVRRLADEHAEADPARTTHPARRP